MLPRKLRNRPSRSPNSTLSEINLYTLSTSPHQILTQSLQAMKMQLSSTLVCSVPFLTHNLPPAIVNLAIGSWQLRAGFSTDLYPRFTCTPQVARYRDRKALKTYTICGNDVTIDAACKAQAKSPFDANVISNFDILENLLDYTFLNLRLEGDGSGGVGHPIVMTEAVCNPNYSRRGM